MIYLGNEIYELSNGIKISKEQLKFIIEEFYYDNNFQNDLIDIFKEIGMNYYVKSDLDESYENGKEEGYNEGYEYGYQEGFEDGKDECYNK